jgi:hypothetical protein
MARPVLLAFCLALAAPSLAFADDGLQRVFAERTALIAADQRCGLLPRPVRAALEAGAAQARGALLRGGWSNRDVDGLARRAVALTADQACADARVTGAARSAKAGFAGYARLSHMQFPGGDRVWQARRRGDGAGWLAYQDLGAAGRFGLRLGGNGLEAAFALPLDARGLAPSSARIVLRDARRAPASVLDIPGRPAGPFAQNTPHPAMSAHILARGRVVGALESPTHARAALFSFPADSLDQIARLDPREAAVIEVDEPRGQRRFLVEIGDLAAALAFLRAGAG